MVDWKDKWPERATKSGQVKRSLSTEEKTEVWVYRAKCVHGDIYDYSKFSVAKTTDATTVVCPLHGEFTTTPNKHVIAGASCPGCKTFVHKATIKHSGKYDYSLVDYVNSVTPVTIICPVHGEFSQKPDYHMQSTGCPDCGNAQAGVKLRNTSILEDFASVWGDKYDYSLVEYTSAHSKVKIICPEHGEFMQDPHSHKKGIQGCSGCAVKRPSDTIYIMRGEGFYKIGVTNDVDRRLYENSRNMGQLDLVYSKKLHNVLDVERHLLNKYTNKPSGVKSTEARILTELEVREICEYLETL